MKIHSSVTVEPPRNADDCGVVSIGHYTIDGGLLTMVTENGDVVRIGDRTWTRELHAGDSPRKIAAQLTLSIRLSVQGQGNFHRVLTHSDYPDLAPC
jgi:hypothetical protein